MASTSTSSPQHENEITPVFDEIAPPASTSATSSRLPCDVFINHRGPDVKHTLARAIYNALNGLGLKVFLDSEELESGDFLPTELEAAMRTASLHIAIFSKNYAQSPWCLAELSYMLKTGTTIIPVFYHVDPSDLRWVAQGKGIYADLFAEHEKKGRYTLQKLEEWKMVLHNVSFCIGEIITNNDEEGIVLKNIVNRVLKVMKKVPFEVAKHPVGLNETVKDFERTALESDQCQIVGIWGMGGAGKTTLAKELYNQKYSSMEASSLLLDVRDAAAKSQLHKKQKKLLEDLGVKGVSFDNVEEGKGILSSRLRSVRVLVILDDVDHVDQLEALLPTKDALGWGSLVIVTTRERDVLTSWGISTIYPIRMLNPLHAKQLFCWHAFLQPSPPSGFQDLVEEFVGSCNGLPLSLKVFGSQLYGNSSKDYWKSQLHKLSRILPGDIKKRLRLSYDALDDEEKEAFLDTACFFIGRETSVAIAVWEGSGWSGLYSWQKLVNKCLVEQEDGGRIRMHDHLRDLGKEIAISQSPCRIWSEAQIMDLEKQRKEEIQIRGMILQATTESISNNALAQFPDFSSHMKLLMKSSTGFCCLRSRRSPLGLKVLVIGGYYLNKQIGKFTELTWLCWSNIPHRNLPAWLPLKILRVLELYEAQNLKELWKNGADAPVQLRELVITRGEEFRRFPRSIGCLKHLRKIIVSGINHKVRSLPEEFCLLQSLEHLSLDSCWMLSSLPSNFGCLTNLRHLDLSECSNLRMLPDSFKQVTLLQYLNLSGCSNLILQSDILKNMAKLEYLNLSWCEQVEELPRHITNQACLRELDLSSMKRLREVPVNIGELSKLEKMSIGSPLLTSLPTSLGNLSSLTSLEINGCKLLRNFPVFMGNLSSLTSLKINGCELLTSLPTSLGNLSSSSLNIEDCIKLDSRQGLFNYSLCRTNMSKISISEDCCPCLETLQLSCHDNLKEIENLPTTLRSIRLRECKMLTNIKVIGGLINLLSLSIEKCPELNALPNFQELNSLKMFRLKGCNKVEKIEGLQHCISLETLETDTSLEMLHMENLESIKNLRRLQLKANKRSDVGPCIQSIQKWPEEVIICTKAVTDAGSLLSRLDFLNLSVVDSLTKKKIRFYPDFSQKCYTVVKKKMRSFPELRQKRSSNGDTIMVCFVINCASPSMKLSIHSKIIQNSYNNLYDCMVSEGKWVWIGVFTQCSFWFTNEVFSIHQTRYKDNEVEKAVLVKGEEKRLVESFYQLLTLLGN